MKSFFSILLLIFLIPYSYAQNSIKVGDKAPKINVTDYLLNSPKDKNFENKFIVLEFWATWCAPCLSAVPHLNDLQSKYNDRDDLVFLSLTYEKPEKVKRTLEKVKFNTIVISDQTKQTESNFNVKGIPHTVLIDNRGIIKWIGTPMELTASLLDNLLVGQPISSKVIAKKVEEKSEMVSIKKNVEVALGFLKDSNNHYTFSLSKALENDDIMSIDALFKGKYLDLNSDVKSMFSKINKIPESQIIVPKELKSNYNLLYKNLNEMDLEAHGNILKNNLLTALNLSETILTKKVNVYLFKVNDSKKLPISIDQNEENHSGSNETHFVFSNAKVETLITDMSDYYNVILLDESNVKQNIDLLIKKGSFNDFEKDLLESGFILEKVSKEVDFYNYSLKNKS
jgi:thiol-disulfide isomerase/thioredoxin